VVNGFIQSRIFYYGGGGRRSCESRNRRANRILERYHFMGLIRLKPPSSRLLNLWVSSRGARRIRQGIRIQKTIRFERRRGVNARRRRNRRRRRIWYPNPLWRFLKRFNRFRLRWNRVVRTNLGPYRATTFARRYRWWEHLRLKGFRFSTPRRTKILLRRLRRSRWIQRVPWVGIRGANQIVPKLRLKERHKILKQHQIRPRPRRRLRSRPRHTWRHSKARSLIRVNRLRSLIRIKRRLRRPRRMLLRRIYPGTTRSDCIHPRQLPFCHRRTTPPGALTLGGQLYRWRGLFIKKGGATKVDHLVRQFNRNVRGGILHLYYLFHTPLGARNRRRGGAVLKVPNLLKQHQSWALVRRWFTRGVLSRGDRSWMDRVLHEGIDPARTSRAREDFIRGALLNSALL
jgi:hypothetical protein